VYIQGKQRVKGSTCQTNTDSEKAGAYLLSIRDIAGWQLPEFDDLACEGVAALPGLQRSAVWKARQVEALWNSLVRGFPIGSFLVTRNMSKDMESIICCSAKTRGLDIICLTVSSGLTPLRLAILTHGARDRGRLYQPHFGSILIPRVRTMTEGNIFEWLRCMDVISSRCLHVILTVNGDSCAPTAIKSVDDKVNY